jgi:hypothetical protein
VNPEEEEALVAALSASETGNYEHVLLPLSPMPETKEECESFRRLASFDFRIVDDERVVLSFLGVPSQVRAVAITIPRNLRLNPNRSRWVSEAFETAVAAIRLTHAPETEPFYGSRSFWTLAYLSEESEPKLFLTAGVKHNQTIELISTTS